VAAPDPGVAGEGAVGVGVRVGVGVGVGVGVTIGVGVAGPAGPRWRPIGRLAVWVSSAPTGGGGGGATTGGATGQSVIGCAGPSGVTTMTLVGRAVSRGRGGAAGATRTPPGPTRTRVSLVTASVPRVTVIRISSASSARSSDPAMSA
jgi:hypothetical protein